MNITLIGMAGAGKSVVGEQLAKALGYVFLDIDKEIEKDNNRRLQAIIDEIGDEKFIQLEEQTMNNYASATETVISPGGSIIYSHNAMKLLKRISTIIFLEAPFELIRKRIEAHSRGIVGLKTKSLEDLFLERSPLYNTYADLIIKADNLQPNEIVSAILSRLQ